MAGANLDAILAVVHKLALLIVALLLIALVVGVLVWRSRKRKAGAADLAS
jgi:membrane protein DedA with SNARE-associated domain